MCVTGSWTGQRQQRVFGRRQVTGWPLSWAASAPALGGNRCLLGDWLPLLRTDTQGLLEFLSRQDKIRVTPSEC